ncbi:hypothetical protein GCM10011529_22270 [Polymorphobacter glacialis]|uniref:DUF2059 domain-containing protein n=1 Tax=Sandarakinorhabdus glacialis TaxID=1614636 RepID=A0A917E8J3_9SPHN|nr:hypothetical protein [Polymorphobacter glacialis]GGE15400.1 hypothetical protein GCM10011529_22270 [Polymorphobacter glacialis]
MKLRAALLALLLVGACGTEAAAEGPASDAAIAAIAKPEVQFENLVLRTLFSTEGMAQAAYALGIAQTCKLVRPAFDAAIAKGLPDWQVNLISAYRDNVPQDVLARAVTEAPAVTAATIAPFGDKIGAQMQRDSERLLTDALAATIAPAFEASTKIDPKKIDGVARRAELKQAIADGTITCGLGRKAEAK